MGRITRVTVRDGLLFVNILSLVLVLVVYFLDLQPVRIVLGLPFLLFFPGYVAMAALFPGRNDLGTAERLGLSLGFSVVISSGLGLILSVGWEIRLHTILLSLAIFTAAVSVAAWYRWRHCAEEDRPVLTLSLPVQGRGRHKGVDAFVSVLLALSVAGAVAALAYALANPRVGETFTEFYMYGAETLPRQLATSEQETVTLGIVNREHKAMSYSIGVLMGEQTLAGVGPIELGDGESWEGEVTLVAVEPSARTTLAEEVTKPAETDAPGVSRVQVEAAAGLGPGDHIMIGREAAVVQAIEGQSVVLKEGLRGSHPPGTAVVEAQKAEFRLFKDRALDDSETSLSLWLGKERLYAAVRSQGEGYGSYEVHARISRGEGGEPVLVSALGSPAPDTHAWETQIDYPFSEMNEVWFSLYGDGRLLYETSETAPYPSVYLWIVVT